MFAHFVHLRDHTHEVFSLDEHGCKSCRWGNEFISCGGIEVEWGAFRTEERDHHVRVQQGLRAAQVLWLVADFIHGLALHGHAPVREAKAAEQNVHNSVKVAS